MTPEDLKLSNRKISPMQSYALECVGSHELPLLHRRCDYAGYSAAIRCLMRKGFIYSEGNNLRLTSNGRALRAYRQVKNWLQGKKGKTENANLSLNKPLETNAINSKGKKERGNGSPPSLPETN